MPEKKMKNIKRELIEQKLNLVVEKLMNLGGPENEAELKDGGEAIGFFKRDFGIAEWDWPQGVGLYGLLKMMKIQGKDVYKRQLSPLLANVYLNEFDWEFHRRGVPCIRYADDIVLLAKSERAAERLLESSTKYLEETLKLCLLYTSIL